MNNKLLNYTDSDRSNKTIGEVYYIIAARLRHLRNVFNMTQTELGRKIGLGGTAIANYERPYCEISIDTLKKIADVFGVDFTYFTSDDDVIPFTNETLQQPSQTNQFIPYYKVSNINGLLLKDKKLADGYVSLPNKFEQPNSIICTDIPDNSMIADDYKNGEIIFVNTDARPAGGDVALVYDTTAGKMIIRKYISEGPMVTLIASGHTDIPPIYTDITDPEYQIVGPIVRSTRDH